MGRMSLTIAVALAASIGTGMSMPTGAQARSDEIVFQGDASPGALTAEADHRRFYLAFNQTPVKHAKRHSGKQPAPASSPTPPPTPAPATETRREPPSGELRFGAFPLDPMIPNQRQ
ncbi:MAG TPA: hypothetical protein VFH41_09795 [Bradyrhizobium sp.]|nr:hypothetical protein [Bradyrhizobium sp.]